MATYLLEALDEVKRKMLSSLSSSTYVELAALGVSLSLVATAGGVGVKRALVSRTKGAKRRITLPVKLRELVKVVVPKEERKRWL